MRKARVKVINSKGLHARAAAKLAKIASDYKSIVRVGRTRMVDGKSILSLMMLAAIKGTVLEIETEGIDEDIAIEAIINLVKSGFDEVN
jgi:phosphocarrier protein HPr